jgi:demethylmenaquinone methyltransferase/2-methoxy-6-polyprenyl-1,4-benzoquinol methylase
MNRLMTAGQDVRWRREVIHRAELPPNARLLDLGAGTGDLAREALRQHPDCLPFPDQSFHAVVSGFLLRNVADLQGALQEQRRVLKPGGRLVALDTTRPRPGPFSPLVQLHLHAVIPALGWLITGQRAAYTYLPNSTEGFLRAEELVARLAAAGFRQVVFRRLMLGTIAIHWGVK